MSETDRSDDDQAGAEQLDDDVTGGGGLVNSDESRVDFPPERLHGVPFADADVTDESLEDRLAQEEPEEVPDPSGPDPEP